VAEEIGRGDPGDCGTSDPGASRCSEGPLKKSIEPVGLDGFSKEKG
jgi:hypothetical protein